MRFHRDSLDVMHLQRAILCNVGLMTAPPRSHRARDGAPRRQMPRPVPPTRRPRC